MTDDPSRDTWRWPLDLTRYDALDRLRSWDLQL